MVLGDSGSGKTLLSCQKVAQDYLKGKIDEIVLIRSLQPLEGEDSFGFLPGDEFDKGKFWMRPMLFHLSRYLPVDKLVDEEVIKFFPLEMVRGMTFESDTGIAVIASEIQNISIYALKSLLTRMGRNSRLYCDGDVNQADRGRGHAKDFLEICSQLDSSIRRFKLVQLGKEDIFRDKEIGEILDVFEDFGY